MILDLFILLSGGLIFILIMPTPWLSALSLGLSCLCFLYSLLLWVFFDHSTTKFQYILYPDSLIPSFGVDSLSLSFIVLTTFLFSLCLLGCWKQKLIQKTFVFLFLSIEILLILTFTVLDVLWFYVLFEALLIPIFLIIGIWGSRLRKIRASYYFFLFTYVGSVFLLAAILYISSEVGSTSYQDIFNFNFSLNEQKFLFIGFFLSFATKVPVWPFHIWLPEAHVEAPTVGSAILAGVLLKLGVYGFLRFSLGFFPQGCIFFIPFVFTLCILGIVYTSLTAIRQTDIKRIVAYSSVAHINLVILGIFSANLIGLQGSLIQSLSHGFVSAAIFLLIGILYDRYHTRLVFYISGLVSLMPVFAISFTLFTMANIALPSTSSFVGEVLLFVGIFEISPLTSILSILSIVLSGAYSLWLANRLLYGNLNTQYSSIYSDLNTRELWILIPLGVATLYVGIYPQILMEVVQPSLAQSNILISI